jgi:hypothetical protein
MLLLVALFWCLWEILRLNGSLAYCCSVAGLSGSVAPGFVDAVPRMRQRVVFRQARLYRWFLMAVRRGVPFFPRKHCYDCGRDLNEAWAERRAARHSKSPMI